MALLHLQWYSSCLLYKYKSTNTDARGGTTAPQDTRPGGGPVALKCIPVTLRQEDQEKVVEQLETLYAGQHVNITHFLGATFYSPRSSILIACEYMDLRSSLSHHSRSLSLSHSLSLSSPSLPPSLPPSLSSSFLPPSISIFAYVHTSL